jgi:hypothetical protein
MNLYLSRLGKGGTPASLTSKVGLGVSAASLGLAGANFANNHKSNKIGDQQLTLERQRIRLEQEQNKMDEKSLKALSSIHKALTAPK